MCSDVTVAAPTKAGSCENLDVANTSGDVAFATIDATQCSAGHVPVKKPCHLTDATEVQELDLEMEVEVEASLKSGTAESSSTECGLDRD